MQGRTHTEMDDSGLQGAGLDVLDDLAGRLDNLEMQLVELRDSRDAHFRQDDAPETPDRDQHLPPFVPDQMKPGGPNTIGVGLPGKLTAGLLGLYGSSLDWSAAAGKTIPKIPYLPKNHAEQGVLAWAAPDADSTAYGEGASKSFQLSDGLWQLYGFAEGSATGTLGAASKVGVRQDDGANHYTLSWFGMSDLAAGITGAPNWGAIFAAWWASWAMGNHPHAQHSSFASDDHDQGSGYPYLLISGQGFSNRNACHASMWIGDANHQGCISPNSRILSDTDGTTPVLNWNAAAGTYELTWNVTNKWTAETLLAAPTGAITLDASAGGALTLKAKNASTWEIAELTVQPAASGTGSLYLGAGKLWENIYYNNVAGKSVEGWSTKGGLTGAEIQEITVQLSDGAGNVNDWKLLARPAV